ncbi:MAG TPA: Polyamine aminopropyltransferase [Hyphomicrobiaceae bacterium MAG_BT-2024]
MTRWIEETFNSDWKPSIRADKILHEIKTDHQDLVIFENKFWGKVLILDGIFQLTTRDEFIYHEMMAHVPLISLEKPREVLIIGGGDGGVLREVLKHNSVEMVTLVEIDQNVIDTSVRYYPEIGEQALNDRRTNVVIANGFKFITETTKKFDVIIADSSEPIGPSTVLHSKDFFSSCKKALTLSGIFVTQAGVPFQAPAHLGNTNKILATLYRSVNAYTFTQPCYFGGEFGVFLATDNLDSINIDLDLAKKRACQRCITTKYWTPSLQSKSFILPAFIQNIIHESKMMAV